ncbi:hypothetical protein G7Y89_g1420 [Cudoniella acicularis]|uniref:Uncharacterized protein n=1 Tax=Cudoniella acicularis TaxID=354080 RepID=A0A8H4W707_9HELO|nr:hypothetical protein G7Y89_g1420 [Cudoniella acicularis]
MADQPQPAKRKADNASPTRTPHMGIEATSNDRKMMTKRFRQDVGEDVTVTATSIHQTHPEDSGTTAEPVIGATLPGTEVDGATSYEESEDEEEADDEEDGENDDMPMLESDNEDPAYPEHEEDDDMDPPKLEVEESELVIGGQNVLLQFEGKQIGYLHGRYVNRGPIRRDFWLEMEIVCQELASLAFDIFDRYGRLNRELIHHPVPEGSVDIDWRRKGLGKLVVEALLEEAQTNDRKTSFTLSALGWLRVDIESQTKDKFAKEKATILCRAHDVATIFHPTLGFRRIGMSDWFGLASNNEHPSHKITSTDDYEPKSPDREDEDSSIEEDASSMSFFEREATGNEKDEAHARDAPLTPRRNHNVPEWAKLDRTSNNVLHIAACQMKPQTVKWLLENTTVDTTVRNIRGYTPLEVFYNQLEDTKTRKEHGMRIISVSDKSHLTPVKSVQLKHGCSCEECIEGIMSLRLKFALLRQAEINHDMIGMEADDAELNPSVKALATCLKANQVPSVDNILNAWSGGEWPPVTRNFLQRGTVESSLQVTFDATAD